MIHKTTASAIALVLAISAAPVFAQDAAASADPSAAPAPATATPADDGKWDVNNPPGMETRQRHRRGHRVLRHRAVGRTVCHRQR